MKKLLLIGLLTFPFALIACGGDDGDDDGDTEADELGIASECDVDDDCPTVFILDTDGEEVEIQLQCLTQFTDGYCAIEDCDSAADCPEGSTCVAHEDGTNYCFRECDEKAECNANRDAESEANCSSNFDYADPDDDLGNKACIPPSSGS